MRVLLVSPDRRDIAVARELGKARLRALFPPLSLLQVAALTPPQIEVVIQDEGVQDIDTDASCDFVGITACTSAAPRAYEIADAFRRRGKPVVMGGMHVSACPEEALQHCDSVVVGEAEGKWPRLLEDWRRGDMKRIYRSNRFPDMTSVPPPRRELIRREDYYAPDTIQATRGCAHSCDFCSVSTFLGRRIRARPPEVVAEEMSSLPSRYIVFVDDNIMSLPGYAKRLFENLLGSGKKWLGQASTAVLRNAELLKLAARSGCQAVFVGLETLSNTALQEVNKGFNAADRFRETIKRIHDHGIGVVGAFMFGFDAEDESVFERTVDFVEETGIDLPQYSILTPLPGTPLHTRMVAEGRIIDSDWSHYDGGHAVFSPRRTTPEKLEEGLRNALRRSYSRWAIMRRLCGISARLPLMLLLNLAFRRRAMPFAMEGEP